MSDLQLSVTLQTENLFDPRNSQYLSLHELGLDPSDPNAIKLAQHWINTHFGAIHHNTPFLYLPHVLDIANREFRSGVTSPLHNETARVSPTSGVEQSSMQNGGGSSRAEPVSSDERALLYAVLALGCLREQTYDTQTGTYRTIPTLPSTSSSTSQSPSNTRRLSAPMFRGQSLFRLAQEELDQVEHPSELAVQALFLLHTFVSNTSMSRKSRDYVARAIMMAHEIGLNRRIPLTFPTIKKAKTQMHATRRRAILYLYVYFSDV